MATEAPPSAMQRLLKRLTAPIREFGVPAGALYVIDRVLRSISPQLGLQVYEFMVQPIGLSDGKPVAANGKPLLPEKLAKSLRFEAIGQGHADLALMPAREDIKAQRFVQGARCLGVYKADELMGYLWYCRQKYEEDLVRCDYLLTEAEQSIFDFDLYVMPKHRLGLGFLGIWQGANLELAPQGVRYTFSRLTRFNTASRRAHAHLGWQRAGCATFICAWGMEVMIGTLSPFVSVTWGRRRVSLNLQPTADLRTRARTRTASPNLESS